jgi:hypothetical protein
MSGSRRGSRVVLAEAKRNAPAPSLPTLMNCLTHGTRHTACVRECSSTRHTRIKHRTYSQCAAKTVFTRTLQAGGQDIKYSNRKYSNRICHTRFKQDMSMCA